MHFLSTPFVFLFLSLLSLTHLSIYLSIYLLSFPNFCYSYLPYHCAPKHLFSLLFLFFSLVIIFRQILFLFHYPLNFDPPPMFHFITSFIYRHSYITSTCLLLFSASPFIFQSFYITPLSLFTILSIYPSLSGFLSRSKDSTSCAHIILLKRSQISLIPPIHFFLHSFFPFFFFRFFIKYFIFLLILPSVVPSFFLSFVCFFLFSFFLNVIHTFLFLFTRTLLFLSFLFFSFLLFFFFVFFILFFLSSYEYYIVLIFINSFFLFCQFMSFFSFFKHFLFLSSVVLTFFIHYFIFFLFFSSDILTFLCLFNSIF
ncbi:unnamed protein product [Acanthosepion pharaonis]|uniref:Uncharacterized protein n=1 Tax=Acanthosepion pharaonis TaxID=158019 RepID=A0A812BAF7_ACAPH|nr:unnamed protein product [Sepia pharaonis]